MLLAKESQPVKARIQKARDKADVVCARLRMEGEIGMGGDFFWGGEGRTA